MGSMGFKGGGLCAILGLRIGFLQGFTLSERGWLVMEVNRADFI